MKLEIPERAFGGYIFDCDGTIADTMPLHFEAWSAAMEEMGGHFTEELHYAWGGMPNTAIVQRINAEFGLSLDVDAVIQRKQEHYLARVHTVRPVEPVLAIARRLHGVAPLAVASGGRRELVESTLRALDIWEMFTAVVTADDYTRGKPDPEPFLLAAERIGVPPGECLVFEDTPTGMEAARRAGMMVVLVPTAERSQQSSPLENRAAE